MIPIDPGDTADDVVAKAAQVTPTPAQLAWQRTELSGFVHFGPNTFTGREWGTGAEVPDDFAPTALDTRQWAAAFAAAGFGRVIGVAKHHEGFCLFPSRYTEHSVAASRWHDGSGDVVRGFVDAMRERDIAVGLYLSPADLFEAQPGRRYANGSEPRSVTVPTLVPGDDRADAVADGSLPTFELDLDDYNACFVNQLYELLTEYGPVEEVWLDGANPTDREQPYAWEAWFEVISTLQPDAVVFNGRSVRWVGNESGVARESEWSVLPFVGDPATTRMRNEVADEEAADLGSRARLADPRATFLDWYPAECDASIVDGWFWTEDKRPLALDELTSMYLASVGRNGVLLLNVAPDIRGLIPADQVARLRELGDWVRTTYDDEALVDHGRIGAIVLREPIERGQLIEAFEADGLVEGSWQRLATGTTIGHKRILVLDAPVVVDSLRVRVTAARAEGATAEVAGSTAHDNAGGE
ncbi:MAG: alpha-L-fucosidase [Nocardioidaceae bacterium]|nr:alpha-L-fucosidase [Nocardioidaceae bacterium]